MPETMTTATELLRGHGQVRVASPEFVLAVTGQVAGWVAPVGHPEVGTE